MLQDSRLCPPREDRPVLHRPARHHVSTRTVTSVSVGAGPPPSRRESAGRQSRGLGPAEIRSVFGRGGVHTFLSSVSMLPWGAGTARPPHSANSGRLSRVPTGHHLRSPTDILDPPEGSSRRSEVTNLRWKGPRAEPEADWNGGGRGARLEDWKGQRGRLRRKFVEDWFDRGRVATCGRSRISDEEVAFPNQHRSRSRFGPCGRRLSDSFRHQTGLETHDLFRRGLGSQYATYVPLAGLGSKVGLPAIRVRTRLVVSSSVRQLKAGLREDVREERSDSARGDQDCDQPGDQECPNGEGGHGRPEGAPLLVKVRGMNSLDGQGNRLCEAVRARCAIRAVTDGPIPSSSRSRPARSPVFRGRGGGGPVSTLPASRPRTADEARRSFHPKACRGAA